MSGTGTALLAHNPVAALHGGRRDKCPSESVSDSDYTAIMSRDRIQRIRCRGANPPRREGAFSNDSEHSGECVGAPACTCESEAGLPEPPQARLAYLHLRKRGWFA
jgi:hypothetical protein